MYIKVSKLLYIFLSFFKTTIYILHITYILHMIDFCIRIGISSDNFHTLIRKVRKYYIMNYCILSDTHVRSTLCYLICLRHLNRSRAAANRFFIFFSEKTYFPSYARNMFWVTSLHVIFRNFQWYATKILLLSHSWGRI